MANQQEAGRLLMGTGWLTQFGQRLICLAKSRIFQAGATLIVLLYVITPLPSPLFPDDYSTVVLDEGNHILRAFLNHDEQWLFPPDPSRPIPQKLRLAVLSYEDRYFDYHPGINPVSIGRAMVQNLASKKVVSGASTLTMQVSRLMGRRERTYWNKIVEVLQALKIELHHSKDEILRYYLDHAPYGGNIIGYQAAALRYFTKFPDALSWGEAATLAVLPNAPGLISPDTNRQALKSKRDRLLKMLFEYGHLDREAYEGALKEPLPGRSISFGMHAPHLAARLKREVAGKGGMVRTTIWKEQQLRIEQLVANHLEHLAYQGITNGAVIVAETNSGKVRAYVGSKEFFDTPGDGQVDGVRAARSSGSLLKPLLYALCIDEGIMLPETLLKDVPTYYGSFSPRNASKTFDGMVRAEDALVRSLNVPAVRLLYSYGLHPFYLFLKSAGSGTLFRHADDYGLPLILGGAEVSVQDIAMLYRGLANGGRFGPLSVLDSSYHRVDAAPGKSLVSPAAAWLTLGMMRELRRPGAEFYWEQYQNQWPLAWKTGTSYGQKDAWAVGVSPQWTIAVWVGNFDGEGNANLMGARCAGPLLFDIFNYLPKDPDQPWFIKPADDLKPLSICRDTGYLGTADCRDIYISEAPRLIRPLRPCPYHRRICVATDHSAQVCSICWDTGDYVFINELIYPPDVVQHLRERGQLVNTAPPHRAGCMAGAHDSPMEIIYPLDNAKLWLPRDFGGKLQRMTLRAAHREKDKEIYWYVDDHYLGSSVNQHQMAVALERGWHRLELVDETGFHQRRRFYVDRK